MSGENKTVHIGMDRSIGLLLEAQSGTLAKNEIEKKVIFNFVFVLNFFNF